MPFEWDWAKRTANIKKHGIDFGLAQTLFDGRHAVTDESRRGSEERWRTTGKLEGRLVTVIWTWRGSNIRLVSARSARREEEREYRQLYK